jgi:hypothetical protein
MNKLITDMFVRRVTQGVLLAAIMCVLAGCVLFDYIVFGYYSGWIDASQSRWAYTFVSALGGLYSNDWTPLFATIAGVFPVIVASVCYRVVTAERTIVTDTLNPTGHAFFAIIVTTTILLVLAVLMLTTLRGAVVELAGGSTEGAKAFGSIREMANAALSVYAIYIVQIVGLQAKTG